MKTIPAREAFALSDPARMVCESGCVVLSHAPVMIDGEVTRGTVWYSLTTGRVDCAAGKIREAYLSVDGHMLITFICEDYI